MEEKLVSLMLDKKVYETLKDYCYKRNLKIKHVIRESIITELNTRRDHEKSTKLK